MKMEMKPMKKLILSAALTAVLVDNNVLRADGRPGAPPEAPTCCPVGAPQLQPVPRGTSAIRLPSGTS